MNALIVDTDLRGAEWQRPRTVARNLRYAHAAAAGMIAGTDYGKILAYLSRHPELGRRVLKILQRGAP